MFGTKDQDGNFVAAQQELVRLAIPRRLYTQSHIDYVLEAFDGIKDLRNNSKGYKIVYEPPFLRHFTARLEPIK
jgi:tryptophanase